MNVNRSRIRFTLILTTMFLVVAPAAASAAPLFDARTDFITRENPVSVTSDDFNLDGKPDLAVGNDVTSTVSVLLGDGTGSFGPKTDFATGMQPRSVISDDFNRDGHPDMVAANDGSDTVSVLLGDGTGRFAAKTDFATGDQPRWVTSDDFNGDRDPDLAVANYSSDTVSVLLGDGTGSFGPKTDFATGSIPASVTSEDFDGDGHSDLAVTNWANTVSILLGDGTGSFGPKTDFATGSIPTSVTSEDFDGDGKPDLAVANLFSDTISILLGDGAGSFTLKGDFATDTGPYTVTSDDFNGDSRPDLAVANIGPLASIGPNSISVLLGDGTGSFAASIDFATGSTSRSLTSNDFNRDSKPDLAVVNFDSDTFSILLGDGSPEPSAAPDSVSFPSQTVGTLSSARTVTVTNSTPGYPLLVDRVLTTGADRADFLVAVDDCTAESVPSAGSCEVGVRFAPSATGARSATLEIRHNGPTSPLTVLLSGIADDRGRPRIERPGRTPRRVKSNRVIKAAKVKCVDGTCRIRKVQVRFDIGSRIFNGVGRFSKKKIATGKTRVIRTTMKRRLYRKLKRGKLSGTVTAVVTATSSNGARNREEIRTGLKR